LMTDDGNQPACILIIPKSARLDAEQDESDIIRLTSGNETYDRGTQELEETFVMRVAEAAKSRLPLKNGIPSLFARTSQMLAVTEAMQTTGEATGSTIRG